MIRANICPHLGARHHICLDTVKISIDSEVLQLKRPNFKVIRWKYWTDPKWWHSIKLRLMGHCIANLLSNGSEQKHMCILFGNFSLGLRLFQNLKTNNEDWPVSLQILWKPSVKMEFRSRRTKFNVRNSALRRHFLNYLWWRTTPDCKVQYALLKVGDMF